MNSSILFTFCPGTRILLARKKLAIAALFLFFAAAVSVSAQQSVPVQGGGTLTFEVTTLMDWCNPSQTFYTRQYNYSDFVYINPSGASYPLSGTATAYQVTGDNVSNCPPAPPSNSLQLTSPDYIITFTPSNGSGTALFGPYNGQIYPKYQVLTVDYAPPGMKSTVAYANGYVHGTSKTDASTYSNAYTLTVSVGFKVFGIGATATASGGYTQEQDSSNSNSVNVTTTEGYTVPGPTSSAVGVDHSNDIIWVWLNPAIDLTVTSPDILDLTSYDINPADPLDEMDYIPLYAGWLQNPSTIPADVASRLARTWDTSGVGGLTAADYVSILAADPFAANPSYDPNTDTTARFTLQENQLINYVPAGQGDQPIPQSYSFMKQTVSGTTNSSKDTRTVSASLKASFKLFGLGTDATGNYKYTSTSQWTSSTTDTANQSVTINITPPAFTDNYTGPTAIQAWVDNVYGAYMFFPVE